MTSIYPSTAPPYRPGARWTRHPAQVFVAVTAALTLISFASPITTSNATTSPGAIVIPALARSLAR
jgi:hypothetical protein